MLLKGLVATTCLAILAAIGIYFWQDHSRRQAQIEDATRHYAFEQFESVAMHQFQCGIIAPLPDGTIERWTSLAINYGMTKSQMDEIINRARANGAHGYSSSTICTDRRAQLTH